MDDDDIVRKDIRRLLKTFGVKSDEAIIKHFARNPTVPALKLRLTLEDLTDYGERASDGKLALTVEDSVRR